MAFVWTDEKVALLRKLWVSDQSAKEIAKALGKGLTRNAVIGKAHRLDLPDQQHKRQHRQSGSITRAAALVLYEGMKQHEAARHCGCREKSLNVRLSRIRRGLMSAPARKKGARNA